MEGVLLMWGAVAEVMKIELMLAELAQTSCWTNLIQFYCSNGSQMLS
jgi:hypothetical protein